MIMLSMYNRLDAGIKLNSFQSYHGKGFNLSLLASLKSIPDVKISSLKFILISTHNFMFFVR